jgi:prepilin-type N-terminal cleavage/methylation domain-containing protein
LPALLSVYLISENIKLLSRLKISLTYIIIIGDNEPCLIIFGVANTFRGKAMLKAVCNSRKKKKGFTLIELLIVVAIIAILAAIAVPQFSQYRVRSYNSVASSDIRNIKVQTEAYRTYWQVYASSEAGGVPGLGAVKEGPSNVLIDVALGGIAAGSPGVPSSADADFSFGVSNGVNAVINTGVGGENYVSQTKHTNGDRIFAADSDISGIKWKTLAVGSMLQAEHRESSDDSDNLDAPYEIL